MKLPKYKKKKRVEKMSITTEKEAWAAVRKWGFVLKYVSGELKTPELCLEAVKYFGYALQYVPEGLKTPELCLEAVREDGFALEYVPEALKTPKLCLEAVKRSGFALKYVPEALKTPKLCLEAVKSYGSALEDVPEALKTPKLCLAAVKQNGIAICYVPKALKTPELCLEAVKRSGFALDHVPEALKTPELCLEAVREDGFALEYVPEALKTYDLCLAAVKQNEKAIIYVPKGLRAKIKAATQPKRRGKACLAPLAVPTKTVKGTFTDPRDGKVYKTVEINDQVWMAENLNFDCEGSKCYNPPKNAEKCGRLYDWETAKKACPPGWHLPSNEEWDGLVDFAGGEKIAGKKLKAESGWNENGNGTDDYGFSALPGGYGFSGCFGNIGSYSYWWSANEDNSGYAYFWYMHYQDGKVGRHNNNKSYLHSVRCVQDKVLPKGIRRGKKK